MTYLSTQPYKGTRDFFPEEMRRRRWMFAGFARVVERFGYQEYDGPMLEPFELYAAKSGEELVNQQLYSLVDRGERKLAVRPEMTPTLARMVASKVQELPRPVRWYSLPNLWRYERPQRGRLREHWQLNVDVLGGDPARADAEILEVAGSLLAEFKAEKLASIRVNHRRFMDQWFREGLGLGPEAALGVTKAIDAREKIGPEKYAAWLADLGVSAAQREQLEAGFADPPALLARVGGEGAAELQRLLAAVPEAVPGVRVVFDPTIMRGLDYYTGTVFEIFDESPVNRRALFGGGRYDNLLGLFGPTQLSGVGFGMGDVGFENFLGTHGLLQAPAMGVDAFVALPTDAFEAPARALAADLRRAGLSVVTPLAAGGFGAQLKQATKLGARFAVLFGDAEWARGAVLVKELATGAQAEVARDAVAAHLASPAR